MTSQSKYHRRFSFVGQPLRCSSQWTFVSVLSVVKRKKLFLKFQGIFNPENNSKLMMNGTVYLSLVLPLRLFLRIEYEHLPLDYIQYKSVRL